MILFTIVLIALLVLAAGTIAAILLGGAGVLVAFGDAIIFGLIICIIIKLFRRKKK